MAQADLHRIRRFAALTVGCFALAATVACVAQGPGDLIIFDLFLAVWIVSPALAASGLVLASAKRAGATAFLGLELLCIATTLLLEVLVSFFPQSAYDGLALFALPLGQWLLVALFMIGAFILGWRDRDEEPSAT